MQKAMRRTLGVGGATAVAFAASLALAGVASAHDHSVGENCAGGVPTLNISLTNYNAHSTNTITAKAQDGGYLTTSVNGSSVTLNAYQFKNGAFSATIAAPEGAAAADKVYTFSVSVTAGDNSAYSFSQKVTFLVDGQAKPCSVLVPPTKPTTTTTAPPTTTKSTPPPTTTSSNSGPTTTTPPRSRRSPTRPRPRPVASPTPVSAPTLPLIIAGVLIVLGAGALFAMRIMKRRRAES